MEQNGKHINVYRGMWAAYIVMVAAPVGAFALLYYVIDRYFDHPFEITLDIALGGAGIIGAVFTVLCTFKGVGGDLFSAIGERIRETREFYGRVFSKDGIKYYFSLFIEDGGPILWSMVVFFLIYAAIGAYGMISFFAWWNALPNKR